MSREQLDELLDRVPEQRLDAVYNLLETLTRPGIPVDDEPLSPEDIEAIHRGRDAHRAGRLTTHEELMREFGLK